MSLKICLLSLEWPPYGGGIGTYMFNLATGLRDLGHNVTVLTHDKNPEQIAGINIAEIPVPNGPGAIKQKLMRWRWEPHQTWAARAKYFFDKLNTTFDILETAEYGAWAKHFIGHVQIPIVVRCHTPAHGVQEICENHDCKCKKPLWLKFENRRERKQTNEANAISTPSFVLANHISLSWCIPFSRITVLPNPADTELFKPSEKKDGKKKEILFVGRLQYNKGIFDLIESVKPLLKIYSDLMVRIIGKDQKVSKYVSDKNKMASEEVLARIPYEYRQQISIAGWVPTNELIEHQQNAMCAVVPSRGFESFSYTLIEHMSCGTAAIATHCGGPTEIIEDGVDGIMVPAGDSEALTSALRKLIENPSLSRELGRNARKKAEEKYSIKVVVPQIAKWYEKIIDNYQKKKI
ncbi:MAG: GDP-mannose-dependent alpha-(1-2)-phosphatidylinositol mannosyltransferase [Planctomycetes bacterium ADurb.Bin401]|nr:MAG: GDP-mannose-dependent alpha-(1-2)-phosphatidylinositol mannosyltransferase [Planctomycetes bacterium ADurb.Bin401]